MAIMASAPRSHLAIDDGMHLVESARAGVAQEMPGAPLDDRVRACEQRALLVLLENLMTFPWVRARVAHGTLTLHGWYFNIEHRQLQRYNASTNAFESL